MMLESAELNSKLAKTNHNFFGMRLAKRRPTTAIGERGGYAIYASWYDCVLDYAMYQEYMLKERVLTKTKYLVFLGHHYAEDKAYIAKIKRNMKTNKGLVYSCDSMYSELTKNKINS